MKPKLLIIEDNEDLRKQMKWGLAQEYEVFDAGDRLRALQALTKESPDLVTLDLGLPPDPDGVAEGFSLLAEILEQNPLTK